MLIILITSCSTTHSSMSAKRIHLTQQHWSLCGKHLQSSVRQTFTSNNTGPKWSCDCWRLVNLFTKQLICFLVSLITCWMLQPPRPSAGCVTQNTAPLFFPFFTQTSYYSRVGSIIGAGGLLFRAHDEEEVALPLLQLLRASCVTGNCHVSEPVAWVCVCM